MTYAADVLSRGRHNKNATALVDNRKARQGLPEPPPLNSNGRNGR